HLLGGRQVARPRQIGERGVHLGVPGGFRHLGLRYPVLDRHGAASGGVPGAFFAIAFLATFLAGAALVGAALVGTALVGTALVGGAAFFTAFFVGAFFVGATTAATPAVVSTESCAMPSVGGSATRGPIPASATRNRCSRSRTRLVRSATSSAVARPSRPSAR